MANFISKCNWDDQSMSQILLDGMKSAAGIYLEDSAARMIAVIKNMILTSYGYPR